MFNGYVYVLSPLVLGFLLGWLRKKPAHGKRRYMGLAVLVIIGIPVGTLLLAKLFGSDVLGWLFGLTLIFGLPLVLLFCIGLAAGSFFNRASDEHGAGQSTTQPAIDRGREVILDSSPHQTPMPMGTNVQPTAPRTTAAPGSFVAANRTSPSQDARGAVTCRHLQPIEHAMRLDGLAMRKENASRLSANCRIDLAKLNVVFGSEVAGLYMERHEIDRSYLDPKSALFWCVACQSQLAVVHPEEARPGTPWFPREDPERC